jgi:hypothetical protein
MLQLELTILTSRPSQLLVLRLGEAATATPTLAIRLLDPLPDRPGRSAELRGRLFETPARTIQPDHMLPEFRGIFDLLSGHLEHLAV